MVVARPLVGKRVARIRGAGEPPIPVKITVKLEYACRILCELARRHGRNELARIEELAKIEAVPANFLAQLLGELKSSGLVVSKRGVQGGFLLARAPDRITLRDIIKATEGELLELSGNHDGRSGRRMRQVWTELRQLVAERAGSYTLESLAVHRETEMYHI